MTVGVVSFALCWLVVRWMCERLEDDEAGQDGGIYKTRQNIPFMML